MTVRFRAHDLVSMSVRTEQEVEALETDLSESDRSWLEGYANECDCDGMTHVFTGEEHGKFWSVALGLDESGGDDHEC